MNSNETYDYLAEQVEKTVETLLSQCSDWRLIKFGSILDDMKFCAFQDSATYETEEQRNQLYLQEKRRIASEVVHNRISEARCVSLEWTGCLVQVYCNHMAALSICA